MTTLTHAQYAKLKARAPKRQIAQGNADTCEQLLEEYKQIYPELIDLYYMEHLGQWAIRTTDEATDNLEFDNFIELTDFIIKANS